MRIKMTAILLSALLPLSAWAAPGPNESKPQAVKQEQQAQWSPEKMQKRQNDWFDRLELSTEQREAFQAEMQQHRAQQQSARNMHHEKLRGLLNEKQRAAFDQDTKKMQDKMQRHGQKHKNNKDKRSGEYRQGMRSNQ